MRETRRGAGALLLAPLLVPVLLASLVACGAGRSDEGSPPAQDDTSVYDDVRATASFDRRFREDYEALLELPDGRAVLLRYAPGGGSLLEQHYSPQDDAWTSPQVLVESTEPDPCQGIDLTTDGDGLVAAVADFGLYCYDGEPPQQSLALASDGDLTEWDVDSTEGFDGWTDLAAVDGTATWRGGQGERLTWNAADGFGR
ncbi:hypothetical protein [Nocardioides sp. AX2bis]|uniref:hypothetical protein n=1 Tax=Nocardioides sp. AX2bis TaxID=2653157 RepID=UPI0012F3EC5B|nr:hypothetical protein [Nocardioides sp. AX2bis]VXB77579.1 conserved exported hypothetical protein [Nocardioides sp. AX2bis]